MNTLEKSLNLQRNVALSDHSSYEIGGNADFFALPRTVNELTQIIDYSKKVGMPYFTFGLGTNLLFPDHPAQGKLFLSLKNMIDLRLTENVLFVSAGVPLSLLSLIGEIIGLESLYFTHLLPGCIGSGIYINAKCYDDQMSSILEKVYYIDPSGGSSEIQTLSASDCQFDYKSSIFQSKNWIIIGADIKLNSDIEPLKNKIPQFMDVLNKEAFHLSRLKTFYSFFTSKLISKTKPDYFNKIQTDRNHKKHFDYPSCGSVFKNNYSYGTPTGIIVDKLGLKGKIHGGAMISPVHGNFIVNYNHANASDVLYLIQLVQEKVEKSCGFVPEPEVVIIKE